MKKFAVRGSIALVVLFFIALVADSLVAARAEHRISQNIYSSQSAGGRFPVHRRDLYP